MLAQLNHSSWTLVRRVGLAAALALAAGLGGCGDDGPGCGPGTRLVGTKCIPSASALDVIGGCGPGTVQVGSQCVLADAGGGADTAAGTDAVGASDVVAATDVLASSDFAVGTDTSAGTDTLSVTDTEVGTDAGAETDAVSESDSTASTDAVVGCQPACSAGQICIEGACFDDPNGKQWLCLPAAQGDGSTCDCNCGDIDPDCADPLLPVVGCDGGSCKPDGTCGACVPKCAGKDCGPDGCGGNCGVCNDPNAGICQNGTCVAECQPQCEGKACGDDGCGGACGVCTGSLVCSAGQCVGIDPDLSCVNFCGGLAPGGCACTKGCEISGTCCADIAKACACITDCKNKECGDDGCGGVCGTCNEGELCTGNFQCQSDPCANDPCAGHGVCTPGTGACVCDANYTGSNCTACATGLVDYPNCTPDQCAGVQNPCSGHGSCDPISGACSCAQGYVGANCDACATGSGYPNCQDPCSGKNCDDANACTDDKCDTSGNCLHVANTAPCDDGNPCTTPDACSAGVCAGALSCNYWVTDLSDSDDGTCDATHCSLREAIALANSNSDVSVIHVGSKGKVLLTSALPQITAPLTIVGQGFDTVIDGDGKFQVLVASAALQLQALHLTQGVASNEGGAVQMLSGTLTAVGVKFSNNLAADRGGAVAVADAVTLTNCDFSFNEVNAQQSGTAGAALAVDGPADVSACTFYANLSSDLAGAIFCNFGCDLTLRDSSVTFNNAKSAGGLWVNGKATVVNSTFYTNSTTASAGAIASMGTLALWHSALLDNAAPVSTALQLEGTTALYNTVVSGSGGVCTTIDALWLVSSWISDASCGATLSGVLSGMSVAKLEDGRYMPVLTTASPLIDAADAESCIHPLVKGADAVGTKRPQGGKCDIGPVERVP